MQSNKKKPPFFSTLYANFKKIILLPFQKIMAIKRHWDFKRKQIEIFKTIQSRIDFDLLGTTFPFWKRDKPQNAKEAIEYLGEFVVLITIKQNEETRFTLQLNEEKNILLDFAVKRLTKLTDDYIQIAQAETLNEMVKEFGIFTKLGDKLANMAHEVKKGIMKLTGNPKADLETPPKEFLQQIMDRRFSSEKINTLMSDSINKLNGEISEKWASWESKYHAENKQYFQFSFSVIRWRDPLLNESGNALLSSAGSTLALASGWHTLQWSISNFLPGALLASGAIAIFKSMVDKDKTISELQDVSIKLIASLWKHIHETIAEQIKPRISTELDKQRSILLDQKIKELWESNTDLKSLANEWTKKIESTFWKIGIKYSEAEAKFQMGTNLDKGREYLNEGPIEASIYCFGQAFDGFTIWIQRRKNIDWDAQKQTYVQLIELMKEHGLTETFVTEFNKLRRKRNNFIHENGLLSHNEFKKVKTDLKEAYDKLEELVISA